MAMDSEHCMGRIHVPRASVIAYQYHDPMRNQYVLLDPYLLRALHYLFVLIYLKNGSHR